VEFKVYNTLTRKKESFKPLQPPRVTFYVCGPTVYDYVHIGNARVFVVFDVVRRYLEHCGYEVVYVQNFTDIEDKMIKRAEETGTTVEELADRFIEEYLNDASALRVREATWHPRATEHMKKIVEIINGLMDAELAYYSEGDVVFNTENFARYGALSQQKIEELQSGARVEVDESKNNPLDFVLWKKEKPGEPSWDSPWGRGRPGWHIECSAMAMQYLGETIDIHAGGPDLIFPHHENEIAQSEGCTGKPFVRYWMHSGYLNINAEKMSKSLGNVLTVRELIQKFNPLDLRFFLLSAHYRNPLNFSEPQMNHAINGRKRLQNFVENLNSALKQARKKEGRGEEEEKLQKLLEREKQHFSEAMHDDFNTAEAMGSLFNLAKEFNNYLNQPEIHYSLLQSVREFLLECNGVLDILEMEEDDTVEEEIEQAIRQREEARKQKDFATADRIRDELKEKGIILEDTPYGVRWKRT